MLNHLNDLYCFSTFCHCHRDAYRNFSRFLTGGFLNSRDSFFASDENPGSFLERYEGVIRQQKEIDKRYNRAVVKKVTEIDDEDLDAFMMFCKIKE